MQNKILSHQNKDSYCSDIIHKIDEISAAAAISTMENEEGTDAVISKLDAIMEVVKRYTAAQDNTLDETALD